MTLRARDMLTWTKDQVWGLPDNHRMELEFDDGVAVVDSRQTIFSWYCWVYHRHYPNTPLLKSNHQNYRQFTVGLLRNMLSVGYYGALDNMVANGLFPDCERLDLITQTIVGEIDNDFNDRAEGWCSTVDIFDYLEVVEHPEIKRIKDDLHAGKITIDRAYTDSDKVFLHSPDLSANHAVRSLRAEITNIMQGKQTFIARGRITDLDSHLFPYAVLVSYLDGILSLHDSFIESRSASKSVAQADGPVAKTETTNRNFRLLSPIVKNIEWGDCGSTKYWNVKVTSGSFNSFVGKIYLAEDGTLKPLRAADRSMIGDGGRMFKFRTAFTCKHHNNNGICSTCLGEMAQQIPLYTNLGYTLSSVVFMIITQSVLSLKHLDGSSSVDVIELSDYDKQFLTIAADEISLRLADNLHTSHVRLIVSATEAARLTNVRMVDTVRKLVPYKITELTEVTLEIDSGEGIRRVTIPVSMGSRKSSFTHEMLNYIKRMDWKVDPANNTFIIDLIDWDYSIPFVTFPMKQINMVEYMQELERFLRASPKNQRGKSNTTLRSFPTPLDALWGFYEIVSSKLKINIALLEVVALGCMVRDFEGGDCRLPQDKSTAQVGYYESNMGNRSLSAALAYRNQSNIFFDIWSYTKTNRPDSPLDQVCMGVLNN